MNNIDELRKKAPRIADFLEEIYSVVERYRNELALETVARSGILRPDLPKEAYKRLPETEGLARELPEMAQRVVENIADTILRATDIERIKKRIFYEALRFLDHGFFSIEKIEDMREGFMEAFRKYISQSLPRSGEHIS